MLTLRAGVGPVSAFSRTQTARRLRLSTQRVGRIERRGLRRLVGLGRTGTCARSSAASSTLSAASSIDLGGGVGVGGRSGSGDQGAVKGVAAHGGGDRHGPSVPLPPSPPSGVLIVLAFAAGVLALILLVRRELSRR